MFEVLYLPFVLSGGFKGIKGAEIFAFVGLGIYLPGIDAVLPGL